jgi:predicted DsbA family dithiol-disulfide isomerase
LLLPLVPPQCPVPPLRGAVEEGRYRQVVEDAIREAQELGISAVPTFIIGDRFAIQGAQDDTTFRNAMQRLGVKPRSAS